MSVFTDIVEHSKDRSPLSHQRKALKAIQIFIRIANVNIEASLAQVRATLQSAFETTALVNEAFSAWAELIDAINEAKVGELIYHTFSIIAHKWNAFDSSTQHQAHAMLDGMFEAHRPEILAGVAFLPDLSHIESLKAFAKIIQSEKKKLDLHIHLQAFAKNCRDDHIIVVRNSLQELKVFLDKNQDSIHESANCPQPLPEIPELYRSLLDLVIRFKEHEEMIVDLATQCLGILGCVDPNQVDSVRDKRGLLVLSNFDDATEVVEFIAHMLETILVDAFRSAPNGRQQGLFAFVIQELLRVSGIRDTLTQRTRNSPPKAHLTRWSRIPESIQNTLTPYLRSKYQLTNPAKPFDIHPFPISGVPPNHAVWLRTFTFYFLHRAKGDFPKQIFPVISRVVHSHDMSIASFILPFIVQNVVAGGDDSELEFIKDEFYRILNFDITGLGDEEVENIKQCSEVRNTRNFTAKPNKLNTIS
jgi:serine/threonine-protein kinase ATR